ncbi:MAG: hypothetical protein ABIQ11_03540, partial [Saprospiraceae bacterium]
CGYLKSSSIAIELADAITKGYSGCSVCKPPTKFSTPESEPEVSPEVGNLAVYISKTGTKYHISNCRYVSDNFASISLNDAKQQGYSACSVCYQTNEGQNSFSTPTTSNQCSAITKAGTRCTRKANNQNGKCWQHGGS